MSDDNNKDNNNNKQQFTIKLKDGTEETIKTVENPMGSGMTNNSTESEQVSAYHKFRHFMFTHLQNKWIKTILFAAIGAGIIIALEVIFKIVRGH